VVGTIAPRRQEFREQPAGGEGERLHPLPDRLIADGGGQVALAVKAIESGSGAYFITVHDLVTDLGRAAREGRLDRRLRIYLAPKLLVIDEMGYLPLDAVGTTIFFQLISARYEQGPVLLTSNRAPSEWAEVFGDALLASAALDWLSHHARVTVITGESYRQRHRR